MNESKYVRELILHGGVDATHAEDRKNLIRQISGIATNINQMAKRCNETEWISNRNVCDMTHALGEVLGLFTEKMKELGISYRYSSEMLDEFMRLEEIVVRESREDAGGYRRRKKQDRKR